MNSGASDVGEDIEIPDLRLRDTGASGVEEDTEIPELPLRDTGRHWPFFGTRVPKTEIVFFCQVIIIYTIIVWSFYNLTTKDENTTLWTTLLSSCLGYLLPSPTLKRDDL